MKRLAIDGYDEVYRLECGGSVAFVALHAVLMGRAFGGVRIRRYDGEREALDDALALARAMSRKVALTGIPGGGAKAVLIEPRERRADAVRELGDFVESLGGRYVCGPDYGFTADDGAVIEQATRFVGRGELGAATAEGVALAMEAAVEPRVVAIQGLGAVGRQLAALLLSRGARVVASEVRGAAGDVGVEIVDPDAIYSVPCDIFAPCAVGGLLDAQAIARLRCRAVCGAANNPLARDEEDAELLRARGIAYVPDFIANAGAIIRAASEFVGQGALVGARMAAVRDLAREVLTRAAREGRSPQVVAVEMADARITEMRV